MIDQEIQDALRVDPSLEFVARVRTRIANEPAPPAWRRWWGFPAAGALAAAVAIAIAVARPPANDNAELKPRATTEPPTVAQAASGEAQAPPAVAQAFRPAIAGLKPRATTAAPDILLDPAERRALQQFIAGVRDGRVDLAAVQQSGSSAPIELAPIADIVIAPITIEPIAPVSGAEGVRP